MLGDLFSSIAQYYGYKTLGDFLSANFGVIALLVVFILIVLVFMRLLNRQLPSQGKEPGKFWIFKVTMIFFMCAFVFIVGFIVLSEKKKQDKEKEESRLIESPVIPSERVARVEESLRVIDGRLYSKGFFLVSLRRNDKAT